MIKDLSHFRSLLAAVVLLLEIASPAIAQQFDPRPSLSALISAFQRCGPPATYQMLSPNLFMLIAQQTGGSGCYQFIANAGPVTDMRVIDGRQLPLGPVYAVRVTHVGGPVDWFIGFNQITGRVEYLTYQSATAGSPPSVNRGPDPNANIGGVTPEVEPSDEPEPKPKPGSPETSSGGQSKALAAACRKFPQMCPSDGD